MEDMNLNTEQKSILLNIAEETIESAVTARKVPDFDIKDPVLNQKCGAFVTLHTNHNLRGCIGNISVETPLWKTIKNMSVESALNDPRFLPVSPSELKSIDIEISVLSPLKKITDIKEIKVGKHGILIKKRFRHGLLLPQVATNYGWDRIQFLEQTCCKAGLHKDCFKENGCEIYIFSATVFSKKDL